MTPDAQNEGLKPAEEWNKEWAEHIEKYMNKENDGITWISFLQSIQNQAISHANGTAIELVEKLVGALDNSLNADDFLDKDWAKCDQVLADAKNWLTAQKGDL